ncbi:MAG: hypothetical protein A2504_16050 [Bdellovibrionales bacterium RIFOXYD12_FULL_39_22]|nr:MAG: hypothetical protein A2385_07960 [Bdellovibrionales bacterium RIFOXYB1_FULL_39_21]OFZ43006.1 MAG: hypothetical protein A2485_11265 [Bdellovibrionales bacterium RIFOXYC12_FULL_39_17]OFZ50908.1 MAG: hypothetical protein A2404_06875 [Bdellovibrionales bacterium RIFOXYC1_FULL_39_130]OFZ73643.1 MAG: hypothetical protein A2451_06410 [Bdellovibrionales bacterium RIFOXYC2_FULL_39_8]OFZ78131.1 MAG: hypothetical protein A2560_02045 [Bdellovibrionales bacterium RIFOXYD1_FULL_39_84]OFZ93999.1 MAG:
MGLERNRQERRPSNGFMKLYTSVSICSYTVSLKDISRRGAFIKSTHLPKLGEIITYVITDKYGRSKSSGNARVVRLAQDVARDDMGFAIEMQRELSLDLFDELSVRAPMV